MQSFNDHSIFTIDELSDLSSSVKPHLSALHLNIRNLNQHFIELCNFLDHTPFFYHFIGRSETWITPQVDLDCFEIPGYTFVNGNRTFSSGSGVGLYIKSDHTFELRDDLKVDLIESMWIETQELFIGIVYKPLSLSNRDFLDMFEETLHKIFLSKKKCLIMGDFNINILSHSTLSKEYLNLLQSEGFNALIFEATHVSESTQSCIDHIHINFPLPSTSGSVAIELADHLPVFTILYEAGLMPFPDSFEFRDFKTLLV